MAASSLTTARISTVEPVARELECRSIRSGKIKLKTYRPSCSDPEDQLAWPGTITVYVFRKGSRFQERFDKALKAGDDARLIARIRRQSRKRPAMSLSKAARAIVREPVLAEIRYGSRTVATNLTVPSGFDVVAAILPYNGGQVRRGQFELVEHIKGKSRRKLDAIGLVHKPPMTKAEKAALAKVPGSQVSLNVGRIFLCFALSAIAAAFLLTMAGTCEVPSLIRREAKGKYKAKGRLSDKVIRKLGPAGSARELLKIRRQILTADRKR